MALDDNIMDDGRIIDMPENVDSPVSSTGYVDNALYERIHDLLDSYVHNRCNYNGLIRLSSFRVDAKKLIKKDKISGLHAKVLIEMIVEDIEPRDTRSYNCEGIMIAEIVKRAYVSTGADSFILNAQDYAIGYAFSYLRGSKSKPIHAKYIGEAGVDIFEGSHNVKGEVKGRCKNLIGTYMRDSELYLQGDFGIVLNSSNQCRATIDGNVLSCSFNKAIGAKATVIGDCYGYPLVRAHDSSIDILGRADPDPFLQNESLRCKIYCHDLDSYHNLCNDQPMGTRIIYIDELSDQKLISDKFHERWSSNGA